MNTDTDMAGALHLLLSADPRAWQDCIASCSDQDCVVLLGEAVMAMPGINLSSGPSLSCHVVVSGPDAEARGLSAEMAADGVEFVDDAGLVALIESYDHCLSWR